MSKIKDVFICHASEDKPSIVKPLISALKKEKITYWYDEDEINWGDSIPKNINKGLQISRFVIVILTKTFLTKNWPQRELNSALGNESSTGEKIVLPLIVGNDEVRKQIIKTYPILLNDKYYLVWEGDADKIVGELKKCLGRKEKPKESNISDRGSAEDDIPIPKISKEYSQLEKDRFTKTTFDIIKNYFKKALDKLKNQYNDMDFDLEDIETYKFICSIYHRGDLLNSCKIWIGGPTSSNEIAYNESSFRYNDDGSYNDWLTVSNDGYTLGLKASGFHTFSSNFTQEKIMAPKEGAEYFWLRFTERLKNGR